ncbi:MAG: L-lactate permease [Erythrobacter sp.]
MNALLALLPLILLLGLMAGLGWSAARAGLLSAGVAALLMAAEGFLPAVTDVGLVLAGAMLEAAFTTGLILLIVYPALALHEVQTRSGALAVLGRWLTTLSARREVAGLVLAWFFALLLEGAAGFGTPVALVAPMLVALGFAPERALMMALIGHAAGVSFGAAGIPMVPLLAAYGAQPQVLGGLIMLLHAMLGWVLAGFVWRLASADTASRSSGWWALAAALFLIPAWLLARFVGPELPTLGGAAIGLAGFVAALRWRAGSTGAALMPAGKVLGVMFPYATLLGLIVLTRLITPLGAALQSLRFEWQIAGQFSGAIEPLYHPGTMLLAALGLTALADHAKRRQLAPALASAGRRLPPVALALFAALLLARIMVHGGMIASLAASAAPLLGGAWVAAAPVIGALGSFLTGSATASNILFAELQVAGAQAARLDPSHALAGQGFGAAIGNIIAPLNIVAGAATVGLVAREGVILRRMLPLCAVYAGLGGALLWAISR